MFGNSAPREFRCSDKLLPWSPFLGAACPLILVERLLGFCRADCPAVLETSRNPLIPCGLCDIGFVWQFLFLRWFVAPGLPVLELAPNASDTQSYCTPPVQGRVLLSEIRCFE